MCNLCKELNGTDPEQKERNHGLIGTPELAYDLALTYELQSWTLNWEARFIDEGSYYSFESLENNPDRRDVIIADSTFYHDANINYAASNGLEAYIGVDNVFDENPPVSQAGTSAPEFGGGYDNIGTFWYAGLRWSFE